MNESNLIVNIQKGDSESFRKIFEEYELKAVRAAYLITGNQASAEDVVQEAFVTCYFEISRLKNPECFKTWFYRLLVRIAWRVAEKERKLVPVQHVYDEANGPGVKSVEQQYLESETSIQLYEQIQKLDKKKRDTIMLYYYCELSTKEIARVVGCLEGTVKSRLYFARKELKSSIDFMRLKEDRYYGKAESESVL
ncbi:RNA polymerase sigma factor [Clostridium aminobutyricum]|uniref:RNA polymerase sigma factor n=1 Tax=Clostridium aminobutyricum TaxID=33953 RepID=A0A939DA28_CLOAM|nr:RNA polymerase sigma factor [Clostridium aminobutyricum]MBN7773493.1 RNA polymerase sigma factor [Clostridium aminobutyricum]